ncbi:MAG: two pore domain potassium channel family protein [Bacteroidales bacterium]|nr:two pore domain potassium channel family protein [Bacteroidales bacterium]
MKIFLKKLILGNPSINDRPAIGAIEKRLKNIKAIWNNEHHNDIGIEKILRLTLAISQFLFLGTYIKQIFGKKGISYQDLTVDVFVLLKVIIPILILITHSQSNSLIYIILLWFLIETLFYIPTLIFASDNFSKPRSYRRSMLLLFLNYMEIVASFGVIYSRGNYLNKPFVHWFDAMYFSFITSTTIGYGDYFPITPMGKFLVCVQSVVFLIFVVLFLNFFSNRVENKGYFNNM